MAFDVARQILGPGKDRNILPSRQPLYLFEWGGSRGRLPLREARLQRIAHHSRSRDGAKAAPQSEISST